MAVTSWRSGQFGRWILPLKSLNQLPAVDRSTEGIRSTKTALEHLRSGQRSFSFSNASSKVQTSLLSSSLDHLCRTRLLVPGSWRRGGGKERV
ncbi:hypothetical protein L596_027417 [Steinernema carpocapsae]|uniref:Uncharacterized protein n=1 Tax=Steinernema carpocapsae TaxID=34508 RepID=A0A4U5M498_STECR|nr:hypothetical protein L596_027417 [Steinernema carpocapsae]